MHPLIATIEESLAGIVPAEPIEIRGAWSRATRGADGAEVIDARWSATVASAQALAGLAFLHHGSTLYWVKSPPASADLALSVSLHAYANHATGTATFAAAIGTSFLSGVPVHCGAEMERACTLGPARAETGRAFPVAKIDHAAVFALLLPGALVKTGRNHLWHLRDAPAADLPADVRELLTRGRSGHVSD
jgi:hypothetical protein